jgi:hypothetical protein
MEKIICVAIMVLCVISVKADEKTRQIANEIKRDQAAINECWEKYNNDHEIKFNNIEKLFEKALDIETSFSKNYFVTKEEIYEAINDLKSVFLHKRTKEENYDIVAKGILTIASSNTKLDEDISDIIKNANNKSTTDGCKLCTHDDSIAIRDHLYSLQGQEIKAKLKNENLLTSDEYMNIFDALRKEYDVESRKHDKLVSDLNGRIDAFNTYLNEKEKILDDRIRRNENWQMQQKIEEINNKIDNLQMNQR